MTLELWLTFVAASTALLLIPGPTVLLVLSYALSKGRSVAVASAAGAAPANRARATAERRDFIRNLMGQKVRRRGENAGKASASSTTASAPQSNPRITLRSIGRAQWPSWQAAAGTGR